MLPEQSAPVSQTFAFVGKGQVVAHAAKSFPWS
jgi:hypothetical protein